MANGYERALERVPGVEVVDYRYGRRVQFWHYVTRFWAARIRREVRAQGGQPGREDYKLSGDQIAVEASKDAVCEALWHECEWVLVISGKGFHPDALLMLKRAGKKIAAVFTESPYDDAEQMAFAKLCDLNFTNDRASLHTLPRALYLPVAYDAEVHHPDVPAGEPSDVCFVGTGFEERMRFLGRVDWTGIALRLWGYWVGASKHGLKPYVAATTWGVHNDRAAELYRGAAINLNLYRDGAGESMNPRAYELAALGAFQLSHDVRGEAHEVFGDSIGYFEDPEDLQAKVRFYMDRPGLRERMAERARELVQGNSYDDRTRVLLSAMDMRQPLRAVS